MQNNDIREAIASTGVEYWRVADTLGISACTFSVWLRHEFDPERKAKVLAAISSVAEEGKN